MQGPCQANPANYNCEERVAELISRELGIELNKVQRRVWPATSTLPSRWMTEEEKQSVDKNGLKKNSKL
jgi:hypothetical protein